METSIKYTSISDMPMSRLKENDSFGITKYGNGLVTFLKNTRTPITIALQGEWGSGKTSLMRSLQDSLCNESDDSYYYGIWINTWEYSLMSEPETTLKMIVSKILSLIIKETSSGIGSILAKNSRSIFSAVLKTGASIIDADASSITDLFDGHNDSNIGELRSSLAEAINTYLNQQSRCKGFMFFVDDLDRINPETAVQLLELLKNIFTIENCVFVLAIDYDVVIKGLKPKFGELTDKNEREFRSFFDKIIQVPFSMPVTKYDTSKFVMQELQNLEYFTIHEQKRFKQNIKKITDCTVGKNPRSLKRLLNTLSLIKCIHHPEGSDDWKDSLEKIITLFMVSIQVTYPKIYRLLEIEPCFITWGDAEIKRLGLQNLSEDEKEKLKVIGGSRFDEDWEQVLYIYCSKDYYLSQRAAYISDLLNELVYVIKKECEGCDSSTFADLIDVKMKDVLRLSSITSYTADDQPIIEYDRNQFIANLHSHLARNLKSALQEYSWKFRKNTGNGGVNMILPDGSYSEFPFKTYSEDAKICLSIGTIRNLCVNSNHPRIANKNINEIDSSMFINDIFTDYENLLKKLCSKYPDIYFRRDHERLYVSADTLAPYWDNIEIKLDSEEEFYDTSILNSIEKIIKESFELRRKWYQTFGE